MGTEGIEARPGIGDGKHDPLTLAGAGQGDGAERLARPHLGGQCFDHCE